MTDSQIDQIRIERKRLFGVALRAEVEANIDAQMKPLDYERAMKALAIYRKQLPYRGFYTPAFNEVYNRQAVGVTAFAEATAAPLSNDATSDKQRERRDFERVPLATRTAIDARYPDIAALPRRAYEMCIVLASPHYVAIVRQMEIMQDSIVVERFLMEQLRNSPDLIRSHPDYIAMVRELEHMRTQLAKVVELQMMIDAQDLQLASAQGEMIRLRNAIDQFSG